MVLRILKSSQTKASSRVMLHGVPGACLHSRDLVIIKASNATVEAYSPSLVASQFA